MKRFNILVTAGIIGIISLILIPLPTPMLDFLFILNISLSLLILVMTMYTGETLGFPVSPPLPLITTLFRLGLNISSTRKILLDNGYAGQVIKTLGQSVIRGNAVIGFIIFLIIVLAQFIVITKGSERVAEVAVRFILDATPGKQVAIDADLNSDLIDEQQAKEQRSKIQREAGFFGSMDGVTKSVEGDAITSIIITFINFAGGLTVGIMNSQGTIQDIMQIYTIPTIGDGLVPQVPTLLISVATGTTVTRSASENNLSEDLASQFLAQSRVLMTAGVAATCLRLVPGFPVLQILIISSGLAGGGYLLYKHQQSTAAETVQGLVETEVTSEAPYYENIENVYGLLNVKQTEMEFGYNLIPLTDGSSGGNSIDRVVMFRKQMTLDMGFVIPSVCIKDSGQPDPSQYSILLKREEVARGDILMDHYLVLPPGTNADDVPGTDTIDPAFHISAKWVGKDYRIQTKLAGYTFINPTLVAITHLSEVVKERLYELLNRQEVNNLLETLKKTDGSIMRDIIPSAITVGGPQKVLVDLSRERIPVCDMEMIVEMLGDYGSQIRGTNMLIEYTRQVLKRTIPRRSSETGQMKVISLDDKIENMIMSSVKGMDTGSYLALEPTVIQSTVSSAMLEINKIKDLVNIPVVLTSPAMRIYFKKLIDQFYPNVTVVSFGEIGNDVQIQALGSISLGQR